MMSELPRVSLSLVPTSGTSLATTITFVEPKAPKRQRLQLAPRTKLPPKPIVGLRCASCTRPLAGAECDNRLCTQCLAKPTSAADNTTAGTFVHATPPAPAAWKAVSKEPKGAQRAEVTSTATTGAICAGAETGPNDSPTGARPPTKAGKADTAEEAERAERLAQYRRALTLHGPPGMRRPDPALVIRSKYLALATAVGTGTEAECAALYKSLRTEIAKSTPTSAAPSETTAPPAPPKGASPPTSPLTVVDPPTTLRRASPPTSPLTVPPTTSTAKLSGPTSSPLSTLSKSAPRPTSAPKPVAVPPTTPPTSVLAAPTSLRSPATTLKPPSPATAPLMPPGLTSLPAPPAPLCRNFGERLLALVHEELRKPWHHDCASCVRRAPDATGRLMRTKDAGALMALLEQPQLLRQALLDVPVA